MLRHRTIFLFLSIAVLLSSGTVFSQREGLEVSVAKCWQFPSEDIVDLSTGGHDIFMASAGGHVLAISAEGEKLWQTDLGGEVVPKLRIEAEVLTVTSRAASGLITLNRLSLATGLPAGIIERANSRDSDKAAEAGDTKTSAGGFVILGSDAGLVTSLSGSGPVWRFKTGGGISAVIPVDDRLIVISRDNFVYALRAKNGGLEWKRRTQGRIAHYALGKSFLVVSSLDQHGATLIDLASGRISGQIILDPDEQVLTDPVVTDDGFVVATTAGLTGYSLTGCGSKETVPHP